MQRLFLSLAAVVLGCLAIPASLNAQDASDYNHQGLESNRKGDYDKAIADFNQVLRLLDPNDTINTAKVYGNRGIAWNGKGDYGKAIADYNQAIRLNPNFADTYCNRGNTWYNQGECDKAIVDYTETIRLNPNYADSYYNRGIAWRNKGEYDKAIADFTQALAVDSTDADAYRSLAWLQATCPAEKYRDGKKAVENASKANQLDGGKNWNDIDILAAAHAENGDFAAAKEWEGKAIQMATTDKSATDNKKQELNSRLELYQQGKPYHQSPKKK